MTSTITANVDGKDVEVVITWKPAKRICHDQAREIIQALYPLAQMIQEVEIEVIES